MCDFLCLACSEPLVANGISLGYEWPAGLCGDCIIVGHIVAKPVGTGPILDSAGL